MRTLRLPLMGAVILTLLGGLGGAVLAQEEEPVTPALVSGAFIEDDQTYRGAAPSFTDMRNRYRWWAEMDVTSSDPRLVGRAATTENIDDMSSFDDTKLFAATLAIENEEGAWHGDLTGFLTVGGLGEGFALLQGSGAYEGLSALLSIEDPHASRFFEGLIFKGGLPPVPEPELTE